MASVEAQPVAGAGAGAGAGAALQAGDRDRKATRFDDLSTQSKHGKGVVLDAKAAARRDLTTDEWQKYGWAKKPEALLPPGPELMKRLPLVDARRMTPASFSKRFGVPNKPVMLAGLMDGWKAFRKWTITNLFRQFRTLPLRVGDDRDHYPVKMRLKYFLPYLLDNDDDSPLYVFDHHFPDNKLGAHILNHFVPPKLFGDDLFLRVSAIRPPHRWILIGPKRSGTGVHLDPLGTSAWNALVSGHKRWVLMHPDTPKEWVDSKTYMKEGEDNEAVDYFNVLLPRIREAHPDLVIYDFVQNPGETIFVPGGWWHAVLNLDVTVAITQNFAAPDNFDIVWRTTRTDRPDMAEMMLKEIAEEYPDLVARAHELDVEDGFAGPTDEMRESAAAALARQRRQKEAAEELSDDDEDEFVAQLMAGAFVVSESSGDDFSSYESSGEEGEPGVPPPVDVPVDASIDAHRDDSDDAAGSEDRASP